MNTDTNTTPWFKQFWPWALILLPTAGVLASLITITLAVKNAPTITDTQIGTFAKSESMTVDKRNP